MYVRRKFRRLIGTRTEAELLVELLTSRVVLLQNGPNPLNGVQGLGSRIKVLLEKAALCFYYEGSGVLLGTKGAFRVSIDCYDTAWSGHLELEVGVVRHRIESSECGSSEQCMIATGRGRY